MTNALEGVLEQLNASLNLEKELECFALFNQAFHNYVSKIKKATEVYQQTGVMPNSIYDNWEDWENTEVDRFIATQRNKRDSSKENIKPDETKREEEGVRGRPRRNNVTGYAQYVNVKKEKTFSDIKEVKVKTEVEEMPAPARLAPRKRRGKKTEVQVKQEKIDVERRDSDVIIEEPPVTVVEVQDSDGEKTLKSEELEENVRSTRTKTKKLKRTRAKSSDDETRQKNWKRSKSGSEFPRNESSETNYEDAVSALEENVLANNFTFIAVDKKMPLMNATVIIENPQCIKNIEDLMTDDESEDEKKQLPLKALTKTVTKSKPVFSPFEPSPVKKKVQAFEQLTEQGNAVPVRIPRTKTRANAKKQEEEEEEEEEAQNKAENGVAKCVVKEKAKLFTPMASKFLPAAASTTQKSSKSRNQTSNENIFSAKSASALKASQAEYRERERKRREKEQEAMKKKEALLQAQIEEKKRKREEKQLKAQQQREVLEREKLKALEVQRLKDERHKQVLVEQEERKQKQREEIEKKRYLAKIRAVEEKKKEEERRLEEQKKNNELTARLAKQDEDIARFVEKQKTRREREKQVPIYMKTKPPLLPTEDCYDSDDDEFASSINQAQWTSGAPLKNFLRIMLSAGEAIKNTYFSRQAVTPDLQEIFEVIDVQKLKRSSSAIWHKPPRYTMMPTALANHVEDDEFSEDD